MPQESSNLSLSRFQILNGTHLKLIAMISMLIDHAGDVFFPEMTWLRFIGRLAMPLFAFCVSEGYRFTRDKKKYLLRLGIFALLSEIPFDLAFTGKPEWGHQNIMLTFFLAVLSLLLYDKTMAASKPENRLFRRILATIPVLVFSGIAVFLNADYTLFGVLTVFLFYVFFDKPHYLRVLAGGGFISLMRTKGYYVGTFLCLIPLLLYNGKKGRGLKWLFYLFYPGHLLILYVLHRLL
ncbi:MAG: hypothetical protein J6P72_06170 [Firmicutes bacterium]|nr:hypothetical protein [Bacillota bacterium]